MQEGIYYQDVMRLGVIASTDDSFSRRRRYQQETRPGDQVGEPAATCNTMVQAHTDAHASRCSDASAAVLNFVEPLAS
jgi:hypothetical protein